MVAIDPKYLDPKPRASALVRYGRAFAVVVAVAVGLALWGRLYWLPHFRPPLTAHEVYGIDVSSHQGPINWHEVAHDHIRFTYIKANQGETYVNPFFARDWRGAGAAGLERGAYEFFSFCSLGSAQAQTFLRVVPQVTGELAPAIDLELAGNCAARPSTQWVSAQLDSLISILTSRTGHEPVLYVGADFAARYRVRALEHLPLWLHSFPHPPSNHHWRIWQVDASATVTGVNGAVDLDVLRGGL